MTRSPWLRVYDMQLIALFRLGFPPAPALQSLNLAAYRNSQAHSTKGTLLSLRTVTSCQCMVSGSISLPSPGFFSPFPHGTSALSVATEYLALDRGRPRFRQGFSCLAVLRYCIKETALFRVRGFHPLRPAFPNRSTTKQFFHNSSACAHAALQPRVNTVWALPISLAATFGISGGSLPFLISFPELLRWFSSLSVAPLTYFIQLHGNGISPVGLPHSAIAGSQDMCSFPALFAAYHGLLRLVAPRHPPYTYIRLTILSFLLYISPKDSSPSLRHHFLSSLLALSCVGEL